MMQSSIVEGERMVLFQLSAGAARSSIRRSLAGPSDPPPSVQSGGGGDDAPLVLFMIEDGAIRWIFKAKMTTPLLRPINVIEQRRNGLAVVSVNGPNGRIVKPSDTLASLGIRPRPYVCGEAARASDDEIKEHLADPNFEENVRKIIDPQSHNGVPSLMAHLYVRLERVEDYIGISELQSLARRPETVTGDFTRQIYNARELVVN